MLALIASHGMQGSDVQQATAGFFGPVTLAYATAMAGWWIGTRCWKGSWPCETDAGSKRPWLDFAVAMLAVAGVLAMGQLYRAGWLLLLGGRIGYLLDQVLVWLPLFAAMAARRQGGATVWVTTVALWQKLGYGLGLGVVAVSVYLGARGELASWSHVFRRAVTPGALCYVFPVFMEGVAIAYLFQRLRWVLGEWGAVIVPGLVFAAAHVPRGLDEGSTASALLLFFAYNTAMVAAMLLVLRRSRDVIWLGCVHYLMDIPTGAF